MVETTIRSFRFTLDPTADQEMNLTRHAGAARWAYNWALGHKIAAYDLRRAEISALIESGHTEASAKKATTVRIPSKAAIQKHLNRIKGDSRRHLPEPQAYGPHPPCPWWHEVSTHAFQSAMTDCDTAWDNWVKSVAGKRAGPRVGMPRFKRKGRARDSFRLYGIGLRLDGYRRISLPRIGSVRLHDSARRLGRLITRGIATIKNVTVTRRGSRWYACVLTEVTDASPPTRARRAGGTVGVDLGVRWLITLSRPLDPAVPDSDTTPNPRWIERDARRLRKAHRRFSRTVRGSQRRRRAARALGAIHARVAERRAGHLHRLTKRITTTFDVIGLERFDLVRASASARGTVEQPGTNVGVKSRFNRLLRDAALGETRRQIDYKARRYGSTVVHLAPGTPTNAICSSCAWENPPPRLGTDRFACGKCGLRVRRAVNSARNIERLTHRSVHVAPDTEETRNARGVVSSDASPAPNATTGKREGPQGSPRRSNPSVTGSTPVESETATSAGIPITR
ncbi:RNA-guided endonuclease InsQ/TnpB family protein [Embleya hyalina]|uniref:Resolvase n=1 Tax=Embleya hyalina TaxID=516124 RepID=A0A401YQU5_9ACTN|nr:RNA-guided endonuclease TnpB family protein [Embleya hyalina]GCD96963.1 resolvase [Embleya hyalina]